GVLQVLQLQGVAVVRLAVAVEADGEAVVPGRRATDGGGELHDLTVGRGQTEAQFLALAGSDGAGGTGYLIAKRVEKLVGLHATGIHFTEYQLHRHDVLDRGLLGDEVWRIDIQMGRQLRLGNGRRAEIATTGGCIQRRGKTQSLVLREDHVDIAGGVASRNQGEAITLVG